MPQVIAGGDIALIQDNRSGHLSYWQASDHHTIADRHGVSLAPYVHALFGLMHQKRSRHVLVIGCGGGSLATMLARAGVKVTLLDLDPQTFAIARSYFHMPMSVECHTADGARFLARNSVRYDAIVLDAFAESQIPSHFLTAKFFRLAKDRLRRGGIVLVNMVVLSNDDLLFETMARAMAPAWRRRRLLDGKSHNSRNVIAAAGAVKFLRPPRLIVTPSIRSKRLVKALAGFSFRPLR
ncbi:MAG TPA: fused MFS/spermidine synthase [Rhizomicrobium sp.]|nr:fused MFS/spermidine synthase [Rhizomicrobium sp.]